MLRKKTSKATNPSNKRLGGADGKQRTNERPQKTRKPKSTSTHTHTHMPTYTYTLIERHMGDGPQMRDREGKRWKEREREVEERKWNEYLHNARKFTGFINRPYLQTFFIPKTNQHAMPFIPLNVQLPLFVSSSSEKSSRNVLFLTELCVLLAPQAGQSIRIS